MDKIGAISKAVIFAALNVIIVLIAWDGVPMQESSIVWGSGLIWNVDVHT